MPLSQEALGPSGFFSRVSQTLRISLLVYIYIYIYWDFYFLPLVKSLQLLTAKLQFMLFRRKAM